MRRVLRIFGVLILAAIVVFGWAALAVRQSYQGYSEPQVFVEIPRGTSRHAIAHRLQDTGVVRHWYLFEAYSLWNVHHPLEAGEYLFHDPTSPEGAFWKIAMGHVYVRTIVIPEGWTTFDIAAALEREGQCSRQDFLAAVKDTTLIHDLAPDARSLEGYLFPATYQFSRQQSAHDMAAAMVSRFRSEWASLTAATSASVIPSGAGTPGSAASAADSSPNVDEVVKIASLVERETPQPQERPLVSSVFYNRLARGLPLQCDPTVQYALETAGRPVAVLTLRDLQFYSPYNTYRYPGLPPGPIANPGEASLRAALAPARSNYLYFVANAERGHFFSNTLAEQNRNVTIYRRRLAGEPDMPAPAIVVRHGKRRRQQG
jgi:UPF0755 protein